MDSHEQNQPTKSNANNLVLGINSHQSTPQNNGVMGLIPANSSQVSGGSYTEDEGADMEDDFTEGEEEMEFDNDVPAHRRMTVTRVTDHAELANSVLSAQSAPTINLGPISPHSSRPGPTPLGTHIKIEQPAL